MAGIVNKVASELQSTKIKQLKIHTVDDSADGNSLTTNTGVTVSNDTDSLRLTQNGNGPTLLEDVCICYTVLECNINLN